MPQFFFSPIRTVRSLLALIRGRLASSGASLFFLSPSCSPAGLGGGGLKPSNTKWLQTARTPGLAQCRRAPTIRGTVVEFRGFAALPPTKGDAADVLPGTLDKRAKQYNTDLLSAGEDLQQLLDIVERHGADFNAVNVSTALNRLAKAHKGRTAVDLAHPGQQGRLHRAVEKLQEHLQRHPCAYGPQSLSNIAHALAKMQMGSDATLQVVQDRALSELHGFLPQHIAITAWAFASLGQPAPALFDALRDRSIPLLFSFNSQNLSNLAWAFATAQHPSEQLFAALADAVIPCISRDEFNPQALGNIAWSYATVGDRRRELFQAVGRAAMKCLGGFRPEGLASIAWGFGKAGQAAPALFDSISREAVGKRLRGFGGVELSMMACGFAEARHASPALFRAIEARALQIGAVGPRVLANIVWASAILSEPCPRLLAEARKRVQDQAAAFTSQELLNIMFALSVFESLDTGVFLTALDPIKHRRREGESLASEGLCSLFQICLSARGGDSSSFCQLLPPDLLDEAEAEWRKTVVGHVKQSGTQLAVLAALQRLGLQCRAEGFTQDGLFSVDVLVDAEGGRQLAVEVDGPSHFSSNKPFRELGQTRVRRRLLLQRVDTVINIPFFEWDKIRSTQRVQEAYLRERLHQPSECHTR